MARATRGTDPSGRSGPEQGGGGRHGDSEQRVVSDPSELTAEQLERRQRLIDAAFELGAEGGYDAVHMRDVAATANVAMATIYRNFSSKDHLLSAAMTEWTGRLRDRVAQRPPKGDNATEQMIDVLQRACAAMGRQPKLSIALIRALSSPDAGAVGAGSDVRRSIARMGEGILADLDPQVRVDILAVLGHVWYSSLVSWANGRSSFDAVVEELERACHVLIDPYDKGSGASPQDQRGVSS